MRRIILVAMLAVIVGGGVVATAAQTGTGSQPADSEVGEVEAAACATPQASPDDFDVIETATPEIEEVADALATVAASPDASPAVQALDPCATPGVGTPAT